MQTQVHDSTATWNHLRQKVIEERAALDLEEHEAKTLKDFVINKEATVEGSQYLSLLSEGTKVDDLPTSIGLIEGRVP